MTHDVTLLPSGSTGPPVPGLDEYARAIARLRGLPIEDQWGPSVLRHLGLILELGADLESHDLRSGEWPVPSAQR